MDVIKSGLEHVTAGASSGGCPCICHTGWSGADTMALEEGGCGYNCGCSTPEAFTENADANSDKSYRILYPEQ